MIRKYALILLLGSTATIMAGQDVPKVELFGGYNYTRTNTGNVGLVRNGNGWSTSATFNLNKWAGIEADGGGTYGSKQDPPIFFVIGCLPGVPVCPPPIVIPGDTVHRSLYTYSAGPRFAYRSNSRFTPFGHILIGGGHVSLTVTSPFGHFTNNNTSHVLTLGGGVDYRLTDRIALRTQTDLQQSRFFNDLRDGLRVSTGVVFNFGRK